MIARVFTMHRASLEKKFQFTSSDSRILFSHAWGNLQNSHHITCVKYRHSSFFRLKSEHQALQVVLPFCFPAKFVSVKEKPVAMKKLVFWTKYTHMFYVSQYKENLASSFLRRYPTVSPFLGVNPESEYMWSLRSYMLTWYIKKSTTLLQH